MHFQSIVCVHFCCLYLHFFVVLVVLSETRSTSWSCKLHKSCSHLRHGPVFHFHRCKSGCRRYDFDDICHRVLQNTIQEKSFGVVTKTFYYLLKVKQTKNDRFELCNNSSSYRRQVNLSVRFSVAYQTTHCQPCLQMASFIPIAPPLGCIPSRKEKLKS